MKKYSYLDLIKKGLFVFPLGFILGVLLLFLYENWRFFI